MASCCYYFCTNKKFKAIFTKRKLLLDITVFISLSIHIYIYQKCHIYNLYIICIIYIYIYIYIHILRIVNLTYLNLNFDSPKIYWFIFYTIDYKNVFFHFLHFSYFSVVFAYCFSFIYLLQAHFYINFSVFPLFSSSSERFLHWFLTCFSKFSLLLL